MFSRLIEWSKEHYVKLLLLFMVIYMLAEPFTGDRGVFYTIIWMQYLVLVLVFPYLLTKSRKILVLSILAVSLMVYEQMTGVDRAMEGISLIRDYLIIFLNIYITGFLFYYIFGEKSPRKDRLWTSVCIYLLIAISFGNVYNVVEALEPNSFEYDDGFSANLEDRKREFLYFSFITLTTLGYGDVTPLSPLAKRLTSIEACFGILYIALFVGRVISQGNNFSQEN